MWNPAWSVLLYLPSRSTTKALCCGTTVAVRAMTMIANATRTRTVISVAMSSPALRLGFAADLKRKAIDPLDTYSCTRLERHVADVASGPRGAAKVDPPESSGCEELACHADLTDEHVVDARQICTREPRLEPPAEDHQRKQREQPERCPLYPRSRLETGAADDTHRDRRPPDEDQKEICRNNEQLGTQKERTHHYPGPPRHRIPSLAHTSLHMTHRH